MAQGKWDRPRKVDLVLVNASAFCLQTHSDPILDLGESGHGGPKDCWDDGTGHTHGPGNYDSGEVGQISAPFLL